MDKTLLKGLRALEAVVNNEQRSGVTELAQQLNITKSNAHRVLKTLEAAGYVRREGELGRFEPSLKLWELGRQVLNKVNLKTVSEAALAELAAKTRETVHLSVLQGTEVLYIDKIDSSEPVRAYTTIGGRAPCYAVATGKAIIAYQSPDFLERICSNLQQFTPKTLATKASLLAELKQVRTQGFAINQGEWRESVCGIAAPIRVSGKVEAAIGISGPAARMKMRTMKSFSQDIIVAAQWISLRLSGASAGSLR